MRLVLDRRERGVALALALAKVALAGCGADDDSGGSRGDRDPGSGLSDEARGTGEQRGNGRDRPPFSGERSSAPGLVASVSDVVDGDTIELAGIGPARLIGIDTPERGDCYDEATEFTEQRIGGETVRYVVGEEPRDPYDRLLAYVYDTQERMHNRELAEAGYAEVLTIAPNDRYASRFEAAVAAAEARYGSVPRGACEPPPPEPGPPRPSQQSSSQGRGSGGGALAPPPPDLDCSDVGGPVKVGSGDPHMLDADGDGTGCD